MKIKNIISGLILITSLASCNDWLTVYPRTEMPSEVLLTSEQGYKDALTGVYTLMKSPTLYGAGLSFSNIEYMASLWDITTGTAEYYLATHQFNNSLAKDMIDAIYQKQFNVIANINSILNNIDKDTAIFKTPGMYNIIKGECLALRAYIHFDLIRMYGPLPKENSVSQIKTLPYVTSLSKDLNMPVTYDNYKTSLMKDVTDAQALLYLSDPILNYSSYDLRTASEKSATTYVDSDFYAHRTIRMNYYGVKALEARINLWYGNSSEAYTAALEVINATNPDQSRKFTLGSAADMANKLYNLPTEHIFCMHDYSLYTKYSSKFLTGNLRKGTTETLIKSSMFGNTGTDIRELNLWELINTLTNIPTCYILKKYLVPESPNGVTIDYRQIPMLRLSELYLIAVEAGSDQTLWDEYRLSRGLPTDPLPADPESIKNNVLVEFRKELYGEGQLFYAYKRHNTSKTSILFYSSDLNVNYVVPLPVSEITQ